MGTRWKSSTCIFLLLCLTVAAQAEVQGPYEVDADTLHLYHFDGTTLDEAASGAVNLTLVNGAIITSASVSGFGTALNTQGGSDDIADAVNNPLAVSNFVGTDGAFTFEALIKPLVDYSQISSVNHQEIICGDGSDSRAWQFRINNTGDLRFQKLTGTWQAIDAAIPTSGAHAYENGAWFHVAVTYNGDPGDATNLKLYWTKLDSGATEANRIGQAQLNADLDPTAAPDFSLGNESRSTPSENFEGLIDEVRISSIERAPDDMLFAYNPDAPVLITPPADQTKNESETAVFEIVFTSTTTPQTRWYKQAEPDDIELQKSDPNITMTQEYDPGTERYTATLLLADIDVSDSGAYYAFVDNAAGQPVASDTALLRVKGLWAHWTLDQVDYDGAHYKDIIGGRDALAEGSVIFVAGADGTENGAVYIRTDSGWAQREPINPGEYTGEFSLSYWANWQEEALPSDDLVMISDNGASIQVEDGLTANDTWQHICAVFNGNTAKLYLDGVLQGETVWQLPSDTTAILYLGSGQAGQGSFDGYMDDIRIYNYALDDYEVADIRHEFTGLKSCLWWNKEYCDWSGPEGEPDCFVDLYDLSAFALAYLGLDTQYDLTGPTGAPDGKVNNYDFAVLGSAWLAQGWYPESP